MKPGQRLLTIAILSVLIQPLPVAAQTTPTIKIYRGKLGEQHIQMELTRNADATTGKYFYDQFQRDLRLAGRLNKDGRLELRETDATGRHTGTFVCKRADERGPIDMDLECDWSKPNGSGQLTAWLTEQWIDLPKGLVIKPKQIYQRGRVVNLSYPELINDGRQTRNFNPRVARIVRELLGDFIPDAGLKNASFDANYNVLLANDEIISIEISEYLYTGGAHPTEDWRTFNYDVRNDREIRIRDLVRDERAFKAAIWKYAVVAINKFAAQIEQDEARGQNRQPENRDDVVSVDGPAEIIGWGFTPKGVAVYFDFPHVMAVFSKVLVPYSEVKDYVKPGAPISKLVR